MALSRDMPNEELAAFLEEIGRLAQGKRDELSERFLSVAYGCKFAADRLRDLDTNLIQERTRANHNADLAIAANARANHNAELVGVHDPTGEDHLREAEESWIDRDQAVTERDAARRDADLARSVIYKTIGVGPPGDDFAFHDDFIFLWPGGYTDEEAGFIREVIRQHRER